MCIILAIYVILVVGLNPTLYVRFLCKGMYGKMSIVRTKVVLRPSMVGIKDKFSIVVVWPILSLAGGLTCKVVGLVGLGPIVFRSNYLDEPALEWISDIYTISMTIKVWIDLFVTLLESTSF